LPRAKRATIARRRAVEALRNYPILGIRTNVAFLIELLDHPRFIAGDIDVQFLDSRAPGLRARVADAVVPPEALDVAAATRPSLSSFAGRPCQAGTCPPKLEERRRIRGPRCGDFVVEATGNGRYRIVSDGQNALPMPFRIAPFDRDRAAGRGSSSPDARMSSRGRIAMTRRGPRRRMTSGAFRADAGHGARGNGRAGPGRPDWRRADRCSKR
jgi:hypothetical protein